MPKVTAAHRERVRDQILDAAIACFAERGVRATTMAGIIAASGLSAGAIYGYFGSKQELAVAAMRRGVAGRTADVEAAAEASTEGVLTPAGILRALADGLDRDRVPLTLLVQLWGEATSDGEFHGVADAAFAELSSICGTHLHRWAVSTRGLTEGEADDWASRMIPVLLGLAQGLVLQRQARRDFELESYLGSVDELFTESVHPTHR